MEPGGAIGPLERLRAGFRGGPSSEDMGGGSFASGGHGTSHRLPVPSPGAVRSLLRGGVPADPDPPAPRVGGDGGRAPPGLGPARVSRGRPAGGPSHPAIRDRIHPLRLPLRLRMGSSGLGRRRIRPLPLHTLGPDRVRAAGPVRRILCRQGTDGSRGTLRRRTRCDGPRPDRGQNRLRGVPHNAASGDRPRQRGRRLHPLLDHPGVRPGPLEPSGDPRVVRPRPRVLVHRIQHAPGALRVLDVPSPRQRCRRRRASFPTRVRPPR